MPPITKRNTSIILLDVNCAPEFQSASKNCLRKIFASQWFSESKDCTKLILVNTEESNNQLHRKFGRAPHISEVTDVISYDPRLIDSYLDGANPAQGNWLVALALAVEEIRENYKEDKGAITFQILFISDFSSPVDELKEKQLNFLITNLNTMSIFLYIIGPKVKVPKQMSTSDDIRLWMKNVEFVNVIDQLHVVKKLIESTNNSVVCDLELGLHLFLNYKNVKGLQEWHVPLTAGKSLTIPAISTRCLRTTNPPKIKVNNAQNSSSWHLVDDVMVQVPRDNIIGGIIKHGQFIPFPDDVEKNFKCYGERKFEIVGFTDQCNISEVYMRGDGSSYVQSTSRAFNLLMHTLSKKRMCAIARKVYLKNCKPKLVALLPELQENAFILVELPYKENISGNVTEQDVKVVEALDKTSLKQAYDYLTTLDITNPENKDENGSVKFPLASTLMAPIRLHLMNNVLLKNYTGEGVELSEDLMQANDDVTPYLQMCPPRVN